MTAIIFRQSNEIHGRLRRFQRATKVITVTICCVKLNRDPDISYPKKMLYKYLSLNLRNVAFVKI